MAVGIAVGVICVRKKRKRHCFREKPADMSTDDTEVQNPMIPNGTLPVRTGQGRQAWPFCE